MKKINLSNIVAGVRSLFAQKSTFEHIQESYVESIASVMNALLVNAPGVTQMIGLVNSGSGLNYNISAGVVFYNNEVFEVPAFVGVASVGQVPVLTLQTTYRAGDPVVYSDNNTFNTHEVRKLVWSFGVSGSGLCDFSALLTFKSRINTNLLDVPGQLAALVASAPATLDTLNELAAALSNDPNFATTTATALAGKVAKAGDVMTGALEITGGIRTQNSGPYFKQKTINIGVWDMQSTANVTIVHGLADFTKIRDVSVMILNDAGTNLYPLTLSSNELLDAINTIDASVYLKRKAAGFFDSAAFNDNTMNRGWIFIQYEA